MQARSVEDLLNGYGSGLEFESFVLTALRDSDQFLNFEVRRFDWDFGLDAVAARATETGETEQILIEVKYAQHDRRVTLGRLMPAIDRYRQLLQDPKYNSHKLVIITNSSLTIKAREFCEQHSYEIWDRQKLGEIVNGSHIRLSELEIFH